MTRPSEPEPQGVLPEAAAAALTEAERELVHWLLEPNVDANEITRRLMIDAYRDHTS